MTRLSAAATSAWVLTCASLVAADVWEKKPFNTWTADELHDVLTDSPWAGKASIKYVQSSANQPPIQETALVTWASAPVMRQALAREETGPTAEISKEVRSIVERTPQYYVVMVRIANGGNSGSHASHAMQMLDETFLILRDRAPIPAADAQGEVIDTKKPTTPPAAGSSGRGASPPAGPSVSPSVGPGTSPSSSLTGAASGSSPAFALAPGQRGGGGGGSGGSRGGSSTGRSGPIGGRGGGRGFGQAGSSASLIIFRFPREPIALEDKQVEFVTKLCGSNGFRGGAPAPPPPDQELKFDVAAGAQRGGGGGGGTGGGISGGGTRGGGNMGNGPVARPTTLPPCNYEVKKTFKLKPMVVKGELSL